MLHERLNLNRLYPELRSFDQHRAFRRPTTTAVSSLVYWNDPSGTMANLKFETG